VTKYGRIVTDENNKTVFVWFIGKPDVYESLYTLLGLEKPAAGTYDKDMSFGEASGIRARIAVKLNDAAGNPAGRRLLWCASDFLEDCVEDGNLNGEAYGAGGEVIASAYIPRARNYA